MKIKADEELFNRFKDLSIKVRALGSIVQNDMEVTEQEFKEWLELTQEVIQDFNDLQIDTVMHVK